MTWYQTMLYADEQASNEPKKDQIKQKKKWAINCERLRKEHPLW